MAGPVTQGSQQGWPPQIDDDVLKRRNILKMEIPLPGKTRSVLLLPEDIDNEDWEFLDSFVRKYVELRQKREPIGQQRQVGKIQIKEGNRDPTPLDPKGDGSYEGPDGAGGRRN